MKKISIRTMVMCALTITALSASATAYAEGSKDLIENGGYRPFLEWQEGDQMGFPRRNVVYVYAQQGEIIEFGSSVPFCYEGSVDFINTDLSGDSRLSAQIKSSKALYGIGANDNIFPTIAVTLPIAEGGEAFDPSTASSLTANPGSVLKDENYQYVSGNNNVYFFGYNPTQNRFTNEVGIEAPLDTELKHYVKDEHGNYRLVLDNDGKPVGGNPYVLIAEGESVDAGNKYRQEIIKNTNNIHNGQYANAPGYIANCNQEAGGEGYTPLSFEAPVTGTYAFRFLSLNGRDNPEYTSCEEDFAQPVDFSCYDETGYIYNHYRNTLKQLTGTVAAWDITVKTPNYTTDSEGNQTMSGHTTQSGRVWTNMIFLNMGGNRGHDVALNSNVYVLTHDGFKYQVNFNGIDPFGFAFYSNKRGLLLDEYNIYSDEEMRYTNDYYTYNNDPYAHVRPLLHSFYSKSESGNDVGDPPVRIERDAFGNRLTAVVNEKEKELSSTVLANATAVDGRVDLTHKIFFNEPDNAAIGKYTQKGLIKSSDDISVPANPQLSYTGKGGEASNNYFGNDGIPCGTQGIGGDFKVTIPKTQVASADVKTLSIKLDFSGYKLNVTTPALDANTHEWQKNTADTQTDQERNNIVILKTELKEEGGNALGVEEGNNYVYTLIWNGKDAYGNDVPRGTYTNNIVSASWEAGRTHFPLLDVEGNPNGIKIKRLDIEDDAEADTVYYNNEAYPTSGSTTAWYFTNDTGASISGNQKIGDNKNMTAGVSSNFDDQSLDGAMAYGKKNANGGYSSDGDFCAIDLWSIYTKDAIENFSIGVKAPAGTESTSGVYVSFVAADGKINDPPEGTPFTESHVKYFDSENSAGKLINSFEGTKNKGNQTVFGNTISTGFIATLQSLDTDLSSYRNIKWDISVPAGSYVKVNDDNDFSSFNINLGEAILTDEKDVPNKGVIKEITGIITPERESDNVSYNFLTAVSDDGPDADPDAISEPDSEAAPEPDLDSISTAVSDGAPDAEPEAISDITQEDAMVDAMGVTVGSDKLEMSFEYAITTTISGKVSVVTGIVIDNLYAPGASATAKYGISGFDVTDITNIGVDKGTLADYEKDDKNEYYTRYHDTPGTAGQNGR